MIVVIKLLKYTLIFIAFIVSVQNKDNMIKIGRVYFVLVFEKVRRSIFYTWWELNV